MPNNKENQPNRNSSSPTERTDRQAPGNKNESPKTNERQNDRSTERSSDRSSERNANERRDQR